MAAVIPTDDIKKLDLSTYDAAGCGPADDDDGESTDGVCEADQEADYSGLRASRPALSAMTWSPPDRPLCGMDADKVATIPNDAIKPVMSTWAR